VILVHDNPLAQPIGPVDSAPPESRDRDQSGPSDDPFISLRQAILRSEQSRIIGLMVAIAFILAVVVFRALFGGVAEQYQMLPRFATFLLASLAYEGLMLVLVSIAQERTRDLPLWGWYVNAVIEALIPTTALFLLTTGTFIGPYRALSAPATHGYYIFIILSILRLRPGLCFFTGLASALGYAAATVYTLVVYPPTPGPGGPIYPLQVYATFGIFLLTCGTIAAWLAGQFHRHVTGAVREAAIRGQYESLVRETAKRKRAEAALRASEYRYRQLTEATLDAIVVADQQGTITLFNPAAQALFGYSEPEVQGQPITFLMPEEFQESHRRGFQHYLDTRERRVIGRTVEVRGRRSTGDTFPLELSLSAIELPDGISFLGAIRDVTERQLLQGRIVHAEKMASLGLLSAGVAHEMNNPLAYVTNNLAVIERDVRGLANVLAAYEDALPALASASPELVQRLARVAADNDVPYIRDNLGAILASTRKGLKRVSDIVQNLRGFARLDQAAIDLVDLNAAIASSLDLIRGRLEAHQVEVVRDLGGIPRVNCAPAQINQVILSLLLNAEQAIEAGGRQHGRIEIRTRGIRKDVVLEITDDGCGIPPAIQSRIFDPFFTTKPVGEGTGLGLSISHAIVTDHGGRIEVESRPGEGALFRVILPIEGKRNG
jgi:PAS domain S-box-containing protein